MLRKKNKTERKHTKSKSWQEGVGETSEPVLWGKRSGGSLVRRGSEELIHEEGLAVAHHGGAGKKKEKGGSARAAGSKTKKLGKLGQFFVNSSSYEVYRGDAPAHEIDTSLRTRKEEKDGQTWFYNVRELDLANKVSHPVDVMFSEAGVTLFDPSEKAAKTKLNDNNSTNNTADCDQRTFPLSKIKSYAINEARRNFFLIYVPVRGGPEHDVILRTELYQDLMATLEQYIRQAMHRKQRSIPTPAAVPSSLNGGEVGGRAVVVGSGASSFPGASLSSNGVALLSPRYNLQKQNTWHGASSASPLTPRIERVYRQGEEYKRGDEDEAEDDGYKPVGSEEHYGKGYASDSSSEEEDEDEDEFVKVAMRRNVVVASPPRYPHAGGGAAALQIF